MPNDSKNILNRGLDYMHTPFSNFMRAQTTSSLFLLVSTIIALWWANSAYSATYLNLVHTPIGISLGNFELQTSLKHIINDGLMVIFFLLLGLEIKREVLAGDLAEPKNRHMLIFCAIGGMVVPAGIYSLFNWGQDSLIGWGIPMATDTAFALGVLTIVRKHIPTSLLAFIVGLAIVDDVGAILVIAVFYTQEISVMYLSCAVVLFAFLVAANYAGIRQPLFYIIIGLATWWMMLQSGVHPTVAGVAIALTAPARSMLGSGRSLEKAKTTITSMQKEIEKVDVLASRQDHKQVLEIRDLAENAGTPLRRWEDVLHLPVALFILPLFALVNAGVVFNFSSFVESLSDPVVLGIISGLVVGKFIGISGACWLALRYKIGCLPEGINLQHVIGASLIAGIGFTMSTFIATLGFDGQAEHLHNAKTSVLVASVLSAILGVLYIRVVASKKSNKSINSTPK
ncbi:Na+/H+ antiporter NhaA [Pseudoalteromonas sp. NZS100]|uniref:Na+/H+ antiporter NhaA n=1 Tax=Pseudoalteromonas sp. NZS100 TaxID=2792046 RepID=UPI0018CD6C9B|nr:Na+/H+ antiporter NhaA [Pseudoalteromonas sp. NZS100]MBH0067761.1 Na+/H+ antiporter NhaA [Pseudoalteromonas sp. NZS100]